MESRLMFEGEIGREPPEPIPVTVEISQWGQYRCGGLIAKVTIGGFEMEARTEASPGSETGKRFIETFEALKNANLK